MANKTLLNMRYELQGPKWVELNNISCYDGEPLVAVYSNDLVIGHYCAKTQAFKPLHREDLPKYPVEGYLRQKQAIDMVNLPYLSPFPYNGDGFQAFTINELADFPDTEELEGCIVTITEVPED